MYGPKTRSENDIPASIGDELLGLPILKMEHVEWCEFTFQHTIEHVGRISQKTTVGVQ
jgi:hypothetical protein